MNVLIVESQPELGKLWRSHVLRLGANKVTLSHDQASAMREIMCHEWDVIVLNLVLADGGSMAVSDYVSYRQPKARVLIVNSTSFFSDGSIFNHIANARACLPSSTRPEDLAQLVVHYGQASA